ncbi:MAG: hypothetical protein JWN61_432 [Pseudonocardiales bacterium]|nr:hypothetical protein [Jatrophihabitantaceae bacterium]MCW2602297.1 hypothetical protein [Pseudonocardiales bacterium]
MTSSGAPKVRWWRATRDQAQANARESQGRAARALVELDAALGRTRSLVQTYAEIDPGHEAQRLQRAWAPIDAQADAAMTEYLDAVSAKDLDTDVEEWVAQHAVGLFAGIAEKLSLATRAIEQFQAAEHPAFNRVTALQSVLPKAVADARAALDAAQQAIDAAKQAGFKAREPEADLAAARADLDQVASAVTGPGGSSAQHRLDAVKSLAQLGARIARRAQSLGAERDALARRIVSIRTAAAVAADQAADLPEILSELRRDYIASAFAAVEGNQRIADAALADVDEALTSASRLIADDSQRYDDAGIVLDRARASLDEARSATHGVADRLSALNAVKGNATPAWDDVRRALRDAQRFAVGRPGTDPQTVAQLDGLAVRLDAARNNLGRAARPDYGAYLDELDAVRAGAARIVARLRGTG